MNRGLGGRLIRTARRGRAERPRQASTLSGHRASDGTWPQYARFQRGPDTTVGGPVSSRRTKDAAAGRDRCLESTVFGRRGLSSERRSLPSVIVSSARPPGRLRPISRADRTAPRPAGRCPVAGKAALRWPTVPRSLMGESRTLPGPSCGTSHVRFFVRAAICVLSRRGVGSSSQVRRRPRSGRLSWAEASSWQETTASDDRARLQAAQPREPWPLSPEESAGVSRIVVSEPKC